MYVVMLNKQKKKKAIKSKSMIPFTSSYVQVYASVIFSGYSTPSPKNKLKVLHCVYIYVPVTYHVYNIDYCLLKLLSFCVRRCRLSEAE